MPFKSLLAVVGVSQLDDTITCVVELAQSTNAHLTILVAAIAPPFPTVEYAMVPDLWLRARENDLEKLRQRTESIRILVTQFGSDAKVGYKYVEAEWAHTVFGRWARCVDMSLVHGALLADESLSAPVLNGLLFESGGPVLLFPYGARPTLRPRRAMVAWDGSIEAARAVRASISVLAGSDEVVVVIVDPNSTGPMIGGEPGSDLAGYLAHHGARVRIDRLPAGGRKVSDVLTSHAAFIDADLIVMGGYGHSRLRERIFGGVTQSMLENLHKPLLIAH